MNTRFNKIFFCIFLKSCRPRAMFQKWKNGPTNWRDFIRMIQKKVFMRLESHRSIVLPYILLSQWRYSLGRRIFLAWSSTTSYVLSVPLWTDSIRMSITALPTRSHRQDFGTSQTPGSLEPISCFCTTALLIHWNIMGGGRRVVW